MALPPVLITPIGSAGDNFPFIGVGRELRRRGHDVTVATSEHFESLVRACGLHYTSIASHDEYQSAIRNPDLWHPQRGFATVMQFVKEQVTRLFDIEMRFRETHPDGIIVHHALDFAARAIAEKFDYRTASLQLQPIVVRTVYEMPIPSGRISLSFLPRFIKRWFWNLADWLIVDRHAAPIANQLRARLGLAPARHLFDQFVHAPRLSVGLWPAWFAAPQPDYPRQFQLTGFPLFEGADEQPVSAQIDAFLAAGAPPVVFTPGSANVFGHDFFAAAAEAARRTGLRAMLLSRHGEHIPPNLPDSIRHFDFAPLGKILPRCAALVHHGGIGTTAAALAAGIPQIICPMSHDQPDNAHRIRKRALGDRLMPARFKPKRLAPMLQSLLSSSSIRENCRQAAQKCDQDQGLARACDLIQALA